MDEEYEDEFQIGFEEGFNQAKERIAKILENHKLPAIADLIRTLHSSQPSRELGET